MIVPKTSLNPRIALSEEERKTLQDLAIPRLGPPYRAQRASIVLLSADGYTVAQICKMLGCSSQTVRAWRRRFQTFGIPALQHPSSSRRRTRHTG